MEEIRGARESVGRGARRVDILAEEASSSTGQPGGSVSQSVAPLFAVFSRLARATTEAEVLATIIDQGVPAVGASSATLALLSEDASHLRLAAVSGRPPEALSRTPAIPLSAPVPLAWVAANGEPLWCAPQEAFAARFPAVAAEVLGQPGSLAYLPLQTDDRLLGVLSLRFAETRTFDPDERDQLVMAAGLFATALEHVRALEQVGTVEQQRDEVLAIVGHELRNPLTSISGYLQLLMQQLSQDPIDRERALAAVQQIARQTRRLEQLLASLLDRSRIQQGLLSLEVVPCDLCALVRDCAERFTASPEWSPSHDLQFQLEPELPGRWDPLRIEQVIINLLSNAVKYSPAGGRITIVGRMLGELVELTVADEGVGISPEDQERLFEPFMRSSGQDSRAPGIGLGLHIVATIVEQHQGAVAVESKPGGGTSVTVLLPCNPFDAPLA